MQSALAAGRSVFYGRIRKGGWSLKCIVKNARVFEDGRIVQRGSHADLLASGGLYARFWHAQAQYYRPES